MEHGSKQGKCVILRSKPIKRSPIGRQPAQSGNTVTVTVDQMKVHKTTLY